MTRVLLIGITPEAIDISDPDLLPGITREKIVAGVDAIMSDKQARGWDAGFCSVLADDSAEGTIATSLAEPWDCNVIGGDIRLPSRLLPFFERVVNAVRCGAPGTPIAFNTSPIGSANAAQRWLADA